MHPIHKRILGFFALSCGLTWAGIPGNMLWPSDWWLVPMNPFGPVLAALIVIPLTEGRQGLRAWWKTITRYRAPGRVYAAAFFIPLAIIVASFALTTGLGANLAPLPRYGLVDALLMIAIVPFFGPIPEEPAFRGYGLDQLQRTMSPLAASLWIGFGVVVWHAPLLVTGALPLTILLPLAGVAVVYGWLYRAGGSVWPLVVLHAQLNVVSAMITGPMMPDSADQTIFAAFLGVFYIGWAILIIFFSGSSFAGRRADPGLPLPL